MKKFTLFLSALLISMVSMAANYVKVTAAPADWSGEYLLVYEGESATHVWTGVDAANGNVEATATDGTISGTDFVTITVAQMEGGYSIKVNGGANDGKYISGTSGSNKLNFGADAALNTLAYEDGSVKIVSNTSVMRFNNAKDNMRFRYFKSSTYTGQQTVQLYKNTDTTTPDDGGETPDDGGETPDDGGETPEPTPDPENPEGVITCAEAVAICEQVGSTATTEEYTVRGYVTSIKYSWNEQYGTATFWIADTKDGGDVLQAYSCAPLTDNDKVFAVGAYVELVGKLKKYNTTNEVEKGTYTIITPADNPVDPEQPENPDVETVGNGTEENPFTVEDVIALNNTLSGKHYVKAYIVGQATGASFVDGLDLEAPFEGATNSDGSVATQGTNLAIASTLTPDTANIIPVQLPKNNLRDDFNLVEHPEMLGKQVLICGELVRYFSLTGIKNPTSIVLVNTTETAVDNVTVNQNITKFFENGQLIIIKDGVKFNAQGQVVK